MDSYDHLSDYLANTPPNILDVAQNAANDLLLQKSMGIYEKKYNFFKEWCRNNEITKYSEHVLVAYFSSELKNYKASTTWSIFSMLKTTLKIKDNIDISKFHKLAALIEDKSKGYKVEKSEILEKDHLVTFFETAPDATFLMIEVGFIIGISGACRREELTKLKSEDIEDKETILIIRIPETKNGSERDFTILNPTNSKIDYLAFIRKNIALRPPMVDTSRFFLKYANKCTKQPVGINTFGRMPSIIAKYLNLPDPAMYTGHCFRRSSATMLENSGGDLTVKKHGGWKSSTVAEGYVDSTLSKRNNISNFILMNDDNIPSTSQNNSIV